MPDAILDGLSIEARIEFWTRALGLASADSTRDGRIWVVEASGGWRRDGARQPINFDGTPVDEIRYRLIEPARRHRFRARSRTIEGMTDSPTATRPGTPIPLPDDLRAFLDETRFATIATLDPGGTPRHAVIWYTVDGDEIVLNSAVGRRWPSNLIRDPRVAFSVVDNVDGYRWVGITGVVTVVEDQATAQADIAGMARRYHADDPAKAERLIHGKFERQARISFRLRALGITDHQD